MYNVSFQGESMKVYLLQWHFSSSDGWDTSDGMIGIYQTEKGAEEAGNLWLGTQDAEYYSYSIEEMTVHA
jgi:hypothetical protein